jgi:holo-[acyl-carrier protein] synthase
MIYGIGTDIVEIARIDATLQRQPRFAQRILGPNEWLTYERRRQRNVARGVSFLATRFSAKEAFSKACGLGMRSPMTWQAIEILSAAGGRPFLQANGPMLQWLADRRLVGHVTVSDEVSHAVTFVVLETESEK